MLKKKIKKNILENSKNLLIFILISLLILPQFVWPSKAYALDTGAVSPGTMADDSAVGTVAWSGPNSAKTSNDIHSDAVTLTSDETTHYLKATNFGFSIPVGATIEGILVEIERHYETLGAGTVRDSEVKIVKPDGSIGTTNKGDTINDWPASDAYKSYGSSYDNWGETWTSADINDSDFGVVLSASLLADYSLAYVDHIRITVYYNIGFCSITTAAGCAGTILLRMSGRTNAHPELPSESNANYANNVVCCTSASAIGNSCSGNYVIIGSLSSATNGHFQENTYGTYGNNFCLSSTTPGDEIEVGYQDNNCSGYDTFLFSTSSSDNGTVGIGGAYTRKVCATIIPQLMTFDLDTTAVDGETGAPYTVPLGILSSGAVTHSDGSTINMIVVEGETNATGGMNITIKNSNGTDGLKSTSVSADKISSSTATMAAGTSNYGLCVASAGLVGFTRAAAYATSCSLASGTNAVVALSTSTADILTSSAPVAAGHAEIVVNAAISTTTPAHADYTDTLTFIATASF